MMAVKKAWVVLLTVIVAFMFCACGAQPFRLHVIAHSNSASDQQIKLEVRDAVLQATQDGILECGRALEAEEYIQENIGIILNTANAVLDECGVDYSAEAQVGTCHFPDKTYQDVTYPEGDYRALRIVLGDGEGENWWCVMFPPLCLSEIEADDDTEYTSYIAELIEKMFGSRP